MQRKNKKLRGPRWCYNMKLQNGHAYCYAGSEKITLL